MECPFDGRCRWCRVDVHGNGKIMSVPVSLLCDDTVAVARQKVASALGIPAPSVALWTWLRPSRIDCAAFAEAVVASSRDASDAALSDLLSAWTRGLRTTTRDIATARRDGSAEGGPASRAAAAVERILAGSGEDARVACVLGARVRGMVQPTPDPSGAPIRVDRGLVGPDGAPRTGSLSIDVQPEADLLEDVVPGDEDGGIEAATLDPDAKAEVVAGHLIRWFPQIVVGSNEQGRVLKPVVAHADRSVRSAHDLLPGVVRAVSTNMAVMRLTLRVRTPAHAAHLAADSGAGARLLAVVFADIKISRAAGVIATKLFNGASTAFKVNRSAVGDVDPAVMRRWATPVVIKGTTSRPKLWVYSPLATIIIGVDLAVSAYVNSPGVHEDEAEAWVRGRIEAINETIMPTINAAAAGVVRIRPFDEMGGAVTCSVHLRSEGASALGMPKAYAIASVVEERLSAFFVVLSDAPNVCMLYKRSGRATSLKNAGDLVRLMRSRPADVVMRELVTMFGMAPSAAASFYAAQMASWEDGGGSSVWSSASGCALMRYLDFAPSVQVTREGSTGLRVTITDVRSMRMARRIVLLLQLAFSMASRNGVAQESMPPAVEVVVAGERGATRRSRKPTGDLDAVLDDEADEDGIEGDDAPQGPDRGDRVSHDYLLEQLQQADGDLFRHKATEYATNCGHNQGRQPIVVTRDELANIDRKFPGAHTGAIVGYGSSQDKADRNAYICPKVWCPKSRVALSSEQFESLGRRCPYPGVDEEPLTFETKYFDGKGRYPGFLDGNKHPRKLCMPCCFIKPGVRVDQCGATTSHSASAAAEPSPKSARDSKYIRGDVVPIQPGRYGMLPPDIASAFGAIRCGNREDGSGQLMNQSNCYVRCGVQVSQQNFLTALAHALSSSGAAPDLATHIVDAIRTNLTADEFVTLSGGRLCRAFMNGVDPAAVARDPEFVRWYSGKGAGSAESYLARFGKGRDKDREKTTLRDALIWAAMMRYLEWLGDDTERKTHAGSGLLELASRPLPWLNPSRVNLLLIERPGSGATAASGNQAPVRTRAYVVCPEGAPSSHWRLSDPVAILVRQGEHYEPVARVHLTSSGIVHNTHLSPESIPSLSNAVRILLQACGGLGRGTIGLALALLAEHGHAAAKQVVDYSFRMVGVLTESNLFVPLAWDSPLPVLVSGTGSGMGLMYLSDIGSEPTELSAAHAELLLSDLARRSSAPGIEPVERVLGATALRLANGAIVPLRGFDVRSPAYLPTLNAVIDIEPRPDTRLTRVRAWTDRSVADEVLRTSFSHAMLASPATAREVVALRSPRHPLPLDDRRAIASGLITREHHGPPLDADRVAALADRILFHPRPLQPPTQHGIGTSLSSDAHADIELLSDVELASGVIEVLIAKRMFGDPPTSRRLLRRASVVPAPPYVQADLIPLVQSSNTIGADGKSSSASSSHRSKKLQSKRPLRVFLVDPFIVFHLAHRMLRPDAPIPFAAALQMVQERVARSLRPGADAGARPTDGTLQALLLRNVAADAVVDAVAERGMGYVTSTFELRSLSDILGVPAKVTPPSDATVTTANLTTSGWLGPPGPTQTHFLVLSERSDGLGHDLVMPPLVNNVGHGLLFPTNYNQQDQKL